MTDKIDPESLLLGGARLDPADIKSMVTVDELAKLITGPNQPFDFTEICKKHGHDSLVAWFFIHAIVKAKQAGEQIGQGPHTVIFQVDGVNLDFVGSIRDIEVHMKTMVEERAVELVEEKIAHNPGLNRLITMMDTFANEMRDQIKQALGVDLENPNERR